MKVEKTVTTKTVVVLTQKEIYKIILDHIAHGYGPEWKNANGSIGMVSMPLVMGQMDDREELQAHFSITTTGTAAEPDLSSSNVVASGYQMQFPYGPDGSTLTLNLPDAGDAIQRPFFISKKDGEPNRIVYLDSDLSEFEHMNFVIDAWRKR